jgi:glycosyltransferase involved in cell wall biosynthesis|nr:glycosyltransferase family 4 protein [Odoribacter splanchnicus]
MIDKLKFFLISNMYPTKEYPGYGSFVKNVCEGIFQYHVEIKSKSVIYGKSCNKFNKLLKYTKFYIGIILNFWGRYDFIYIHFPNQAIPILKVLYLFKKPKIVVNFHGEDLLYPHSGFGNMLGNMTEKFCRHYADIIIVPSQYFKEIVKSRNLIDDNKIIVSPSGGINRNFFYYEKHDSTEILHIGFFGRLEDGKGYKEFLHACVKLKQITPSIKFKALIIGYGTKRDEVIQFIQENQMDQIITLLPGVSQSELGNYYRDLDLFIFSSSRIAESLGLTGIEAMACGVPVIGSEIGGIKSYLIDGFNGWLVPMQNADSIVEKIKIYLRLSLAEINDMKRNCISTGEKYYSDEVCKKLCIDIFHVMETGL